MVPFFQFDMVRGTLRADVAGVIGQLRNVLDDLELVRWFVMPYAQLHGRLPVQEIFFDGHAVFEAARATHFVRR